MSLKPFRWSFLVCVFFGPAAAVSFAQDAPAAPASSATQDASATAQDAPAAPVSSFTPNWKIGCHGVSEVPLTVDPEQALPLRLVTTLHCGEPVLGPAALEGYTVQIQTADGTTGYLAAMYLDKMPVVRLSKLDAASLKNGVARWVEGAPGCDHFMSSDGSWVESITVDGVTVQASLYDTGWKFRTQIAVVNDTAAPIHIDPTKFALDEIGELGRPLFYQDPAQIARNTTHEALWTEAAAGPIVVPTRAPSSASVNTFGTTYKVPIRTNTAAPNYLLPHQDAENDAVRTQGSKTVLDYSKQVQKLALRAGTVQPNESVSGAVWFERSKTPDQLILRVPIESVMFEFRLAFKHTK